MNIYVSRNGETFGPYSAEQAKQFLEAGQLLATDYALYEGQTEWKTLSDLLGIGVQNQVQTTSEPAISSVSQNSATVGAKKRSSKGGKSVKVKMNRGQTSVVVKKQSIVSRIFSTIIVFAVTCLVVCGAVAGLYFAFPQKIGPMLKVFGIVTEDPVQKEVAKDVPTESKPTNPSEITLNDEERQRLRSANIILLKTEKGDGLRVMSPVDKNLGLSDEDLNALIPFADQILSIDLTYAGITDNGLLTLSKFKNLRELNLEGNKKVTVQGISHLKELESLTYLNLVRTELSDELIDLLISMENLREIYLFDAGLNEDSISRLAEARPKIFVNGG
jgi:hypothetical protein